MLQITEYNISLKLGLQKKHVPLITTERAWASARGSKRSFAPPFGNWDKEPRITSFI